jgi:hypothetical protein
MDSTAQNEQQAGKECTPFCDFAPQKEKIKLYQSRTLNTN